MYVTWAPRDDVKEMLQFRRHRALASIRETTSPSRDIRLLLKYMNTGNEIKTIERTHEEGGERRTVLPRRGMLNISYNRVGMYRDVK